MNQAQNHQDEIERLTELNRRLANQIVGMTDRLETSRRELMAEGWDAAINEAQKRHTLFSDDHHLLLAENPFRKPINPLGETS